MGSSQTRGLFQGNIDFPSRSGVDKDYGSALAGFMDSVILKEHLTTMFPQPF